MSRPALYAVNDDGSASPVVSADGYPEDRVFALPEGFHETPMLWDVEEQEWIEDTDKPLAWARLRKKRDQLLLTSGEFMWPDRPMSEARRKAWRDYRAALRDLPANTTDPDNPDWPEPPENF